MTSERDMEARLREAAQAVRFPDSRRDDVWAATSTRVHDETGDTNGLSALRGAALRTAQVAGRARRRRALLGSAAAVVATVAIVGVGGFAAWHSGLIGGGVTGRGHVVAGMPSMPASFIFATVIDNSPAGVGWSPNDSAQATAKVESLLKGATAATVSIPSPQQGGSFHANTNPTTVQLTESNGRQVEIAPVKYLVAGPKNADGSQSYSWKFVKGVISYRVGSDIYYLKDSAMCDWLKQGSWTAMFHQSGSGDSANRAKYSNAQLAAMTPAELAASNVKYQRALPFASGDITRNVPAKLLLASDP